MNNNKLIRLLVTAIIVVIGALIVAALIDMGNFLLSIVVAITTILACMTHGE